MDAIDDIRAYYDKPECGEDSRLDRYQLERDITLRYLEEVLPPAGRVLEVGAGTGAYTLWLAARGYEVTAVDLSSALMDCCARKIDAAGLSDKVTCHVADARDLSSVLGTDFDAALLMGPLYHLTQRENRLRALTRVGEASEARGRSRLGHDQPIRHPWSPVGARPAMDTQSAGGAFGCRLRKRSRGWPPGKFPWLLRQGGRDRSAARGGRPPDIAHGRRRTGHFFGRRNVQPP
jgi:SAM-dependent methyltransferase